MERWARAYVSWGDLRSGGRAYEYRQWSGRRECCRVEGRGVYRRHGGTRVPEGRVAEWGRDILVAEKFSRGFKKSAGEWRAYRWQTRANRGEHRRVTGLRVVRACRGECSFVLREVSWSGGRRRMCGEWWAKAGRGECRRMTAEGVDFVGGRRGKDIDLWSI